MMKIVEDLLPYNDRLKQRDTNTLDLIVLHCTELPGLQMAREFGERIVNEESQTGLSGHYYVDRNGAVYRYVQDDRVAHHVVGHNAKSIGIELVNAGRYPGWFMAGSQAFSEKYTDAQIESLKELLGFLRQRFPQITRLARHSDLDTRTIPSQDQPDVRIRRRLDPGPLFPWEEIQNWWQSLSV
jgi:N-acetylmuramoyl-L-alanine amidase